ncbi:MAG: serine/threonine-protein phosphatase, partial [Anaerolineales bacterium]|nr:serine/threonine-protein phosphatase [Anaerolineales bacterium]
GKGIPAALLMTVTRTIMRMAIKQGQDFSPQTILRRSNKALYEDLTSLSLIVTAFVAQYLPATQDFIFANAGHSPVIYLPANGTAQLINANETALGVFPTTTFKNQHLRLKPGDIVFIGSDGLWEANNSEDVFNGYEYILRTLEKHAHQPAEIIAGAILDAGKNLSIGPYQEDDQTLMVVKKVG